MPFRSSNTPASFQGYINKIPVEKLDIFVIVYLDDIFVYTEDQGQGHVEAMRWVLDILRKMVCLPIWRSVGSIRTRCDF